MNDPVIDLHVLFVSELGGTVRSFLKPHRCHRAVSILVLTNFTSLYFSSWHIYRRSIFSCCRADAFINYNFLHLN